MIPGWKSVLAAVCSAVLLVLSFPDFEVRALASVAFVPLLLAIGQNRESFKKSFFIGWLFGTIYFTGTVWWLTYSPINYGGFPPWLAYTLLVLVCMYVGLFPAFFSAIMALGFRRFGAKAAFAAPFVWVASEFARYWLSGNSWNAVGYSQAFGGSGYLTLASLGGVYLVSFALLFFNSAIVFMFESLLRPVGKRSDLVWAGAILAVVVAGYFTLGILGHSAGSEAVKERNIVVTQVNVPMAGLTLEKWRLLRTRHVEMAEAALAEIKASPERAHLRTTVVFPESPMNFMYEDDEEFRGFIADFASRNDVEVLFNSAEPDAVTDRYFNSAVMVDDRGRELVQYDKIYLVPFGEFVPGPLRALVPGLIGSFASGSNFNLFPMGEGKAGVMLCYESNFGQLSRRLVADGADILIEMTNDGYLGETPVLRQHLASAVFRAVETNRPVVRATNTGITAYVTPAGEVKDAAPNYQEAIRIWDFERSDGQKTLYVRYGDWIAWLSLAVAMIMVLAAIRHKREV